MDGGMNYSGHWVEGRISCIAPGVFAGLALSFRCSPSSWALIKLDTWPCSNKRNGSGLFSFCSFRSSLMKDMSLPKYAFYIITVIQR